MVVGAFYQMYFFFQVGGPLTAGLISGRGAYWRGAGWAYYRMYFFPGRWAYKFGAYEWQFMSGNLCGCVVNLFISGAN